MTITYNRRPPLPRGTRTNISAGIDRRLVVLGIVIVTARKTIIVGIGIVVEDASFVERIDFGAAE